MRLPVPSNINIRHEIWRGLTVPDFFKVLTIGITSIICAVGYVNIVNANHQVWATLAVIFVTGFAFLFFQRLDNFSPYEIVKISISYSKEQQNYFYKRGEQK